MRKDSYKKYFGMILLAGWMIVIFLFSAQPGIESGQVSDGICYQLIAAVNSILGLEWGAVQVAEYAEWIHYPVRKLAHMTEYGILAALAYWNIKMLNGEENRLQRLCGTHGNLFAFVFAVVYAITDEYHQTYIPGRAGNVFDVCVDSAGALIGLGVVAVVRVWRRRRHGI